MTFALTTFIVSGLGIISLLALKRYQDSKEVLLFWPRFRNTVEVRLVAFKNTLWRIEDVSSKTFYIVLHKFLSKCRALALDFEKKLDQKSHNLLSRIRGRQELQKRGKASVFLHDMTNFRKHIKRD